MDFTLADTTNFDILIPHWNIIQIIQITEYTDFAKLCHAGEQSELYIPVLRFQSAIKWLQSISELLLQFLITDSLQHRFVILIYQNNYTLSGLLTSTLNDTCKTQGKRCLGWTGAVLAFPIFQIIIQYLIQTFRSVILLDIQVEMQYRIFNPILFQLFYCQAGKQFFFSLKVSL